MPECTCDANGSCRCSVRANEIVAVRELGEKLTLDDVHPDDRSLVAACHRTGARSIAHAAEQFEAVFGRAPRGTGDVAAPGASGAGLLGTTFEQLFSDRVHLDRVVRTVQIEENLDYVPALQLLEDWFSEAGERRTGPVTLRDAITRNFADAGAFRQNLEMFETEDRRIEDAIANDDSIPAQPEGQVEFRGETTHVLLESADQGAELLTDARVQERAYLTAIELGQAERGKDGRQEFNDLLRTHAEAGINYPATLQLAKRNAELAQKRSEADSAAASRTERARQRRAEEKAAEKALHDAHDEFRRVRRR